jgi:hypothetical protein
MAARDLEKAGMRELVKEKSVTMEYFLETSHLDAATAEMLKKYDRDGNGSFSKDEVVAIILDLREAMQSNEMLGQSNKLFKRLLMAAILFCILLLTSMFGLSYAVAALTAKMDVNSAGLLTTIDGKSVVATDSTAQVFVFERDEEFSTNCISSTEAHALFQRVASGRNTVLRVDGVNDTHTLYEPVTGSSMDVDLNNGVETTCFIQADGRRVCVGPTPLCYGFTSRRLKRKLLDYEACYDYLNSLSDLPGDVADNT